MQEFCLVTAVAVVIGVAGCGRGSEDSSGAGDAKGAEASAGEAASAQPQEESAGAMATAQRAAQRVAEGAQQVVETAEETATRAQETAVEATEKAQALLEQAKGLLEEKKIQQAGGVLNELAGMTLDDEQQELLAGLKEEVKQLAGEVDKGLGELKSLVAEKNYSEATTLVSQLADYEFSPEQQKLYEDLKAQVQKLMEGEAGQEAAEAVNSLLGR